MKKTYDTPIGIPEDDVYPTASQRHTLESNEWLDDVLMKLGQNLLRKHRKMDGLQSVLLGQKIAFVPQFEEFVQILHVNGNHWITVSTIGCKPATINVYDSQHEFLSSCTKCLIAGIMQSQASKITVYTQDVQWQGNAHDCGLFALANATLLCNGSDLCTILHT